MRPWSTYDAVPPRRGDRVLARHEAGLEEGTVVSVVRWGDPAVPDLLTVRWGDGTRCSLPATRVRVL